MFKWPPEHDKDAEKAAIGLIGLIWAFIFSCCFIPRCDSEAAINPNNAQHVEEAK